MKVFYFWHTIKLYCRARFRNSGDSAICTLPCLVDSIQLNIVCLFGTSNAYLVVYYDLYFNEIMLAINTALDSLAMSRTGNASTDFPLIPSNFKAFST